MKVKVKFFALIRELVGVRELDIDIANGMRVIDLLKLLAEKLPSGFRDYVFNSDEVSDSIIILVNGKGLKELNGLATELNEGDEIAILPPVSGG